MKCGVNSRFYLYMKFKPEYGDSFTYNSDVKVSVPKQLQHLMKRVLERKKGRYDFAKLVDREEGRTIAYFKNGEMFSEESWNNLFKVKREKTSYLKASMAFYDQQVAERRKYGAPPLQTIVASTVNQYGSGLSCALINIRREAMEIKRRSSNFRTVYIWLHPGNQRVAELRPDGITEIYHQRFYDQLMLEQLVPEQILQIKLKKKKHEVGSH